MDHLGKMSTVLRVLTHIYVVSQEIDVKTFICQSKPRHVTPQIDCLGRNKHCSEGCNTHLWGFSRAYVGKPSFVSVSLCM